MSRIQVKNVLLVEDDPEQARLIREMFNDQGSYSFKLTHVKSVTDAEAYLQRQTVAVLLLDLSCCPDASGFEVILRAHAAARGASIVLLSDLEDEAIAMRTMERGVQDYLIKGQFEPRELMRAMRNSIARKILEETLFNEKSRAQITLECIGDAVICTDIAGNRLFTEGSGGTALA
jgi:DNA-binding response OmpR family regulator